MTLLLNVFGLTGESCASFVDCGVCIFCLMSGLSVCGVACSTFAACTLLAHQAVHCCLVRDGTAVVACYFLLSHV